MQEDAQNLDLFDGASGTGVSLERMCETLQTKGLIVQPITVENEMIATVGTPWFCLRRSDCATVRYKRIGSGVVGSPVIGAEVRDAVVGSGVVGAPILGTVVGDVNGELVAADGCRTKSATITTTAAAKPHEHKMLPKISIDTRDFRTISC